MRLSIALFAFLAFADSAHAQSLPANKTATAASSAASANTPTAVVEAQVAAYNRRDLEAFAGFYSEKIRIIDFPDHQRVSGIAQLRKIYGDMFTHVSKLTAIVDQTIVQGHYVITREAVDVVKDGKTSDSSPVTAIYQVEDGKIINVWFLR